MKLWIVLAFGAGFLGFLSWDPQSTLWLRVPGAVVLWDGTPDPAARVYARGEDLLVQLGGGAEWVVRGPGAARPCDGAFPWVTPVFAVSRTPEIAAGAPASPGPRGRRGDLRLAVTHPGRPTPSISGSSAARSP